MAWLQIFFSRFYKQLGAFIVICSIWDIKACSGVLLSQSFQTCGVFLGDFQPTSNEQEDVVHEIIEQLQLNQKISRSLIIKNELVQRDIRPGIFKSMKYDCFLHVHINFGRDFFSTIPPFDDPVQSSLYDNYDMFTGESWYLHSERQYRIFVHRVKMSLRNNHFGEKPFAFYERHFFCTFCRRGLLLLNKTHTSVLSLKLSSFEKNWEPLRAQHYESVIKNFQEKNEKSCSQKNLMYFYRR